MIWKCEFFSSSLFVVNNTLKVNETICFCFKLTKDSYRFDRGQQNQFHWFEMMNQWCKSNAIHSLFLSFHVSILSQTATLYHDLSRFIFITHHYHLDLFLSLSLSLFSSFSDIQQTNKSCLCLDLISRWIKIMSLLTDTIVVAISQVNDHWMRIMKKKCSSFD